MTIEELMQSMQSAFKTIEEKTDATKGLIESMSAKLSDVEAKADKVEKKVLSMEQKTAHEAPATTAKKMTLAQALMATPEFEAGKKNPKAGFSVTLSNPTTTADAQKFPVVDAPYSVAPLAPTGLSGLFVETPVTGDLITVPVVKAWTDATKGIAEGASIARADITTGKRDFKVIKTGQGIDITKEMLEDQAELTDIIERLLPAYVLDKEDYYILNGQGGETEIKGLLHADNSIESGLKKADFGKDANVIDVLRKTVAMSTAMGYTPTHLILNPMDLCDLTMIKDTTGRDLYNELPLSVKVVASKHMPKGKFLVADVTGAKKRRGRDLEIEVSASNKDNFDKDIISLKATTRMAFVVRDPNCFIRGTLEVPKA